jgi:Leucine-rich repeat (LRR) protein
MDHFTSLKTLDLGFNPLKVLSGSSSTSGAISSLRKLESLGLRHTRLSSISDGMLHDLIHLVALDLSDNKFTEVPGELQYAHNLTVLDLDGNKFEKLDKNSFIVSHFKRGIVVKPYC